MTGTEELISIQNEIISEQEKIISILKKDLIARKKIIILLATRLSKYEELKSDFLKELAEQ